MAITDNTELLRQLGEAAARAKRVQQSVADASRAVLPETGPTRATPAAEPARPASPGPSGTPG